MLPEFIPITNIEKIIECQAYLCELISGWDKALPDLRVPVACAICDLIASCYLYDMENRCTHGEDQIDEFFRNEVNKVIRYPDQFDIFKSIKFWTSEGRWNSSRANLIDLGVFRGLSSSYNFIRWSSLDDKFIP